jgi:hypothetical protein
VRKLTWNSLNPSKRNASLSELWRHNWAFTEFLCKWEATKVSPNYCGIGKNNLPPFDDKVSHYRLHYPTPRRWQVSNITSVIHCLLSVCIQKFTRKWNDTSGLPNENNTKDNVPFYLPRLLHFLSYQSNRLLRRSDLHRKKFWHSNCLNDILFFKTAEQIKSYNGNTLVKIFY